MEQEEAAEAYAREQQKRQLAAAAAEAGGGGGPIVPGTNAAAVAKVEAIGILGKIKEYKQQVSEGRGFLCQICVCLCVVLCDFCANV